MKKRAAALIISLSLLLLPSGICYAGDVPETLLHDDHAQLYFGKVLERTEGSVTVLPVKVIKGDVEPNKEITYTGGHMVTSGKTQVGKTYLVGYIDTNNLYYWVTDSTDTKSLKLQNASGMNKRLQDYLNNGDFEKAEVARRAKLAAAASSSLLPTGSPAPSLSQPTSTTRSAVQDTSVPASSSGAAERSSGNTLIFIVILSVVLLMPLGVVLLRTRRRRPHVAHSRNSSKYR